MARLQETDLQGLQDAKDAVDGLITLIGRILSGELSMVDAGRELGYENGPAHNMAAAVNSKFMIQLRKQPALLPNALLDILWKCMEPHERLFHEIFGLTKDKGFVLLGETIGQCMDGLIEECLNKEEQDAVRMFLATGDKIHGFTKACWKLRKPELWRYTRPCYQKCLKPELDAIGISRMEGALKGQKSRMEKDLATLREETALLGRLMELMENPALADAIAWAKEEDRKGGNP